MSRHVGALPPHDCWTILYLGLHTISMHWQCLAELREDGFMFKRVLLIVPVAALLALALLYSQYRRQPPKVSGFVEANEIRVGSRVGGRVQQVDAVEGKRVKVGDVLVTLEPFDLLEQQAQARATFASARAEYEKLVAGFRQEEIAQAQAQRNQLEAKLAELVAGPRKEQIAAAQAQVDLAEAQRKLAELTYNRVSAAFERNAASQDELDRSSSELNVARLDWQPTSRHWTNCWLGRAPSRSHRRGPSWSRPTRPCDCRRKAIAGRTSPRPRLRWKARRRR